jgi:hypothetical protein
MFVASPVRAVAGALLVSVLFRSPAAPPGWAARRVRLSATHTLGAPLELRAPPRPPWAQDLEPVGVECPNTNATAKVRLYRDDGELDTEALAVFEETVAETPDAHGLNPRTIQLAMKAAYHFGAKKMTVVSSYRPGHGPHAAGDALDFRLGGVSAAALAAYLRTLPRAGVGVYTNPRTQYVHIDARDQSFHWLDASPPGKTWREARIADPKREARDDAWTADGDLPIDVGARRR